MHEEETDESSLINCKRLSAVLWKDFRLWSIHSVVLLVSTRVAETIWSTNQGERLLLTTRASQFFIWAAEILFAYICSEAIQVILYCLAVEYPENVKISMILILRLKLLLLLFIFYMKKYFKKLNKK